MPSNGIESQLQSPELIRALEKLAEMQISPKEKLKRIDMFLSTMERVYWPKFFEILRSIPELHSFLSLKIEDLVALYSSFKNYRGEHYKKSSFFDCNGIAIFVPTDTVACLPSSNF